MVLAEDLRQAVLQAALQGKLTVQFDTDSNVDEMLKSIQEQKKSLIADKKIKKEKALSKIQEEDIPFEIPDNWRFTQLGEIALYLDAGKSPDCIKENVIGDEWGVITTTAIQANKFCENENKRLPNDFVINRDIKIEPNDILITRAGPMTRTGIMCLVEDIHFNLLLSDKTVRVNIDNQNINKNFIVNAINSPCIRLQIINMMSGMDKQQVNISQEKIRKIIIPIPPIEEQMRIVDKINEIMPKIDEYEKIEKELEELKKEFPTNMKDALLQAAMQGKLTEQLESDSSVNSIIEQCEKDKEVAIRDGKYKNEKFRGALSEEEHPFHIPDNWKWVYISDMSLFQEGPGILAVDFRTQGVPLIRISGMQEDIVKLDGCNYLDPQMVEDKWKHFKLDLGDIVISTSASMDKMAEVTEETVGAIPYTGLIRFKMYGNINKDYFKYFIKSSFYATQINEQKSGGTIKHYGPTHLKKMLIPIPPLEEQQRIVQRLDALLLLCEDLKE